MKLLALLLAWIAAPACSNLPGSFEAEGPGGLLYKNDETVGVWHREHDTRTLIALEGGGLGGLQWSPSRGHFLMASNFGGVPKLRIATDEGVVRELPPLGIEGAISGATWSPQGDRIAFHIDGWTVGTGGVYVVPANGEAAPRRLTTEAGFDAQWLAWSADGRQLAVAAEVSREVQNTGHVIWVERLAELELIDVESGARERLTELGANVEQLSWSPNGERIAFQAGGALYVIPATGGEPRLLIQGLSNHVAPAWSPDSSALAVVGHEPPSTSADGEEHYSMLVVPLAGEPSSFAVVDVPWHLAWSPDGDRIARTEGARLVLLDPAVGTEEVLQDSIGYGSELDWR